jgi:preprotein translocase subunit SecD
MQKQTSLLALISTQVVVVMTLSSCIPALLGQSQDPRGNYQLIIELQKTPEIPQITERELEAVKKVIEGRINGLGISKPVIKIVGADQILVQLPGVKDPEQAERVLGATAQLEFRTQKPNTEAQLLAFQTSRAELKAKRKDLRKSSDKAAIVKNQEDLQKNNQAIAELFESTNPPLTGKYLKYAYGEATQDNNWNVAIRFDQKGGELFTEQTKNLAGTGRSIGVFLDNKLISAPSVGIEFAATGITGGSAVITGRFTARQANDLGIQLRGGALPVPIKILSTKRES